MRPGLKTIRLGKVYALMALVGALGATALSQTNQTSQTNQAPENQLKQLSLEQLGDIEVTTQAKAPEELWKTPAAVYVITQEDIRRSGATTIPEALRLAPGVEVARISADKWSIGIRGFGSRLNRDVLVLMDGRSVYTTLIAGTYWEVQDTVMEDIDRIEVIRGPGGTVWGPNAVNGVINIITKKAADTQGGLLTGGGGTLEQGFGTMQYGGKIKGDTSYRIFTKYENEDHLPDLNGQNAQDGWHLLHGGFRSDTSWSKNDSLTIQGDLYEGSEGATIVHSIISPPENVEVQRLANLSGGNVE